MAETPASFRYGALKYPRFPIRENHWREYRRAAMCAFVRIRGCEPRLSQADALRDERAYLRFKPRGRDHG